MKNNIRIIGMLVMLLTFGMLMSACAGVEMEVSTPENLESGGMNAEFGDGGDDTVVGGPAEIIPEEDRQEELVEEAYPGPSRETEIPVSVYPVPVGTDLSSGPKNQPFPLQGHIYAPRQGDDGMLKGTSYVDTVTINMSKSDPAEVTLNLIGNLPTPCHELRVVVYDPEEGGIIPVSVYTLQEKGAMCIQVLEPFDVAVSLGELGEGDYTVLINGEQAVEFSIPQ